MLSDEQIKEAIDQMKIQCDLYMTEYVGVSARSVLYELGYHEDAEQILQWIYDRGFTNCLDPHFRVVNVFNGDGPPINEYPSEDVCYWGPDQLKSRLKFIH